MPTLELNISATSPVNNNTAAVIPQIDINRGTSFALNNPSGLALWVLLPSYSTPPNLAVSYCSCSNKPATSQITACLIPRIQINKSTAADLSFVSHWALRQKSDIDNMLPLVRLEDEPKSGAIFVYLLVSATLTKR